MAHYTDSLRQTMHENIDRSFEGQLRDTQEAVRIKSVLYEAAATPEHPFGKGPSKSLQDFLSLAERLGFRTKNLDNYAGYVEMGESGELVGILAHLDVVPEGDPADWRHPPYAAVVDGGALYGRGSIDDKGPAVAILYAMKALREAEIPLKKRFRLILGLDEESGSRCIALYKEVEEIPAFSFSPDAEFPVVNAEKGILRLTLSKCVESEESGQPTLAALEGGERFNVVPDTAVAHIRCDRAWVERIKPLCRDLDVEVEGDGVRIKARGVSAHAMEPDKGENAVQKLLHALAQIEFPKEDRALIEAIYRLAGSGHSGEGLGIASRDDVSGPLTCNLAAIRLVCEGEAKTLSAKLDIRYPVTADYGRLEKAIAESTATAGMCLELNVHKKPLYIPEAHPTVQTLLDAYEAITGDRPRPVSMGGGTYCRFMPNAVSAGPLFPGQPELAHQPDERVALDDLRRSTHIYAEALLRFNGL